jgi:hypothetical protein
MNVQVSRALETSQRQPCQEPWSHSDAGGIGFRCGSGTARAGFRRPAWRQLS